MKNEKECSENRCTKEAIFRCDGCNRGFCETHLTTINDRMLCNRCKQQQDGK